MANKAQNIGAGAMAAGSVPSPASPYLLAAGALANLYGSFSANSQAEDNYAIQQAQFMDEARAREKERKRLLEAQQLANIYSSANYSNEFGQQNKPEWAQFFRQVRA